MSSAGNVTRQHAEWLNLVDASGPFLSLPVLVRAFPQGLDLVEPERRALLRQAFEEWQDADLRARPELHDAWFRFALREALGIESSDLRRGQELPTQLVFQEAGETLRPTAALAPDPTRPPALLIDLVPPGQDLDKYLVNRPWKASPAERMRMLLRATGVRVGLVTNGADWMLVDAPPGELASYATFAADDLWFEEPLVLRAFTSLLTLRRLVGVADDETLAALLTASARDQHEVTDQLGRQVRSAVEVLIQTIDRIDRDRQRQLLAGVDERRLYRAAVTVMMRLVFLFAAEERGLLVPRSDELYQDHYAASTLRDQLEDLAGRHGEEVLERRYDAWCRLLALSRAIHGGIAHEDLRLPAYGGSLFDPDQYPFLEGRPQAPDGQTWRDVPAAPLPIDNRTVLHLLRALQLLAVPLPGGVTETRRLSFYGLSVEQIGHVYEGLLDHTAVRATGPILGLRGAKGADPEIALAELERLAPDPKALQERLRDATGRAPDALKKATGVRYTTPTEELRLLLRACDNDEALVARVAPWAPLLRRDTHQVPVVFTTGSLYVTQGAERRTTGTHYTPPELTEPIVRHTLEPLCYVGPAEGLPREQWQLRPPGEILQLKVCDLAMGSGAFLAQACRYLAARLLEGWESAERTSGGRLIKTPEGDLADGDPEECLVPRDPREREVYAKRIIADRCLFGVDKNPMAVEMAKLSLWLETLKKNAPFTFLDHALQTGDSLLGLSSAEQIEHFHIDPARAGQIYDDMYRGFYDQLGRAALERARARRRELESIPVREIHDIEHKQRLLNEANAALAELATLADVITSAALHASRIQAGGKELLRHGPTSDSDVVTHTFESPSLEGKLSLVLASLFEASGPDSTPETREPLFAALRKLATLQFRNDPDGSPRTPLHWPLAFPEVLLRDGSRGFDAIVGNPPFQGGQKITGASGTDYRDYLVEHIAGGRRGSADLCAYFFLRAAALARMPGQIGLVATNTIAQGDSREVGLDQLTANGLEIFRAVASEPWPGLASLEVSHVWLRRGPWNGERALDRVVVPEISPALTKPGVVRGKPHRLVANEEKSFIGSYVLGLGFVLSPTEAQALVKKDPKNSNVLFPYLNGDDLNSSIDQAPSRWVINFRDWPLELSASSGPTASDYPDCLSRVQNLVYPDRQKNNRDTYRIHWWHYAEKRPKLYRRLDSLSHTIVVAQVSKFQNFVLVPARQVFDQKLVVFPSTDLAMLALLQSTVHTLWILENGSSLETRPVYTPSDCFETFPFPNDTTTLQCFGAQYEALRRRVMEDSQLGLTKTYNRFHDPKQQDPGIAKLRELHVEMDRAVASAYGWSDLNLDHGFHETKQGLRFTVSESARRELLDRLLALNHARYAEEVAAGLHKPGAKKARPAAPDQPTASPDANGSTTAAPSPARPRKRQAGPETLDLFRPAPPVTLDLVATQPPPAPPPQPARAPTPTPPAKPARSTPNPNPPEPPTSARPDGATPTDAILAALRTAGTPQTKAELLTATGIAPEQWEDLIDHLLTAGLVDKKGKARGTRYRLLDG